MVINKKQTGFALLMTLIIVSVIISVGLTILDLTIKQLKLSTNSKDSEIALHAANAGLECAQYWRNYEASGDPLIPDIEENVGNFTMNCFGASYSTSSVGVSFSPVVAGSKVEKYRFEFSWGSPLNRCTIITMMLFTSDNATIGGVEVTEADMIAEVPGYPKKSGNPPKVCEPGGRCTVTSVQGYNRVCGSDLTLPGTIQREVLLES